MPEKSIKLSVNEIRDLGFDWPKYALLEEYCVLEGGQVDLDRTVERLQAIQAYYQQQLTEAFSFKMRTGADYSDFTDRFDDHARMNRQLGVAISYLQEIIDAAQGMIV